LCYADLRPAPAPAGLSAPPAPSGLPAPSAFDPLTAPLALLEQAGGAPALTIDEGQAAGVIDPGLADSKPAAPGWPCARCGAVVPLDDTSCTSCGAAFLEGSGLDDPILGRLGNGPLSAQTKILIMIGGSALLLAVILGLMYVLGTIF
jgi:hypothetical protein